MRATALLGTLLLALGTFQTAADPIPQPGVFPTVDDAIGEANDAIETLPGGGSAAGALQVAQDAFHSLATQPTHFDRDHASPVNLPEQETTVPMMDETLHLDARDFGGPGVGGFAPGVPYTFTASGQYAYYWAPGFVADAECAMVGWDQTWQPSRFVASHGRDVFDVALRVAGTTLQEVDWQPVNPFPAGGPHSPLCSATHEYTASLTVAAWWARVAVQDASAHDASDNVGAITVHVGGAPPQFPANYGCPEYLLEEPTTLQGLAGELQTATVYVDAHRDGGQYPDPSQHFPRSESWREAGHNGIYTCNWAYPGHTYRLTVSGTYTYAQENPLNHPAALAGSMAVSRAVDTTDDDSLWIYLHGKVLGVDEMANLGSTFPAPLADAECTQGLADPLWQSHRAEYHAVFLDKWHMTRGEDYFDLAVNQDWVKWFPANGASGGCDPGHTYFTDYTPTRAGPLHLWIKDSRYSETDNVGVLTVQIERIS